MTYVVRYRFRNYLDKNVWVFAIDPKQPWVCGDSKLLKNATKYETPEEAEKEAKGFRTWGSKTDIVKVHGPLGKETPK